DVSVRDLPGDLGDGRAGGGGRRVPLERVRARLRADRARPGSLALARTALVHGRPALGAIGYRRAARTELLMRDSKSLFEAASRLIPGGVNSPVRAFRGVGGEPFFVARGEGARVWAADGRPILLKFDGCYHGHADSLLVKAGSGGATFSIPDSAGVPAPLAQLTVTAPFNDLDAVRSIFRERGLEIAAVIVEPVAGNMGVVPPRPGFLEGLREITRAHDAVLIFDEVITGFRVAYGGAQELYGVRPDLTCLGKVIGGGLPVGAYGGARRLMSHVAPLGAVYQAGTLSGNPLAVAAGLATLARLRDRDVYRRLDALGAELERGLGSGAAKAGVPLT